MCLTPTSKNKTEEKSSSFSHRVEICGQFLYGRLQVVYGFKAILEETEQETRGASWHLMTLDTGMGTDKILLTQMPLSILFIDPTPYQWPRRCLTSACLAKPQRHALGRGSQCSRDAKTTLRVQRVEKPATYRNICWCTALNIRSAVLS